jgi:hypothetical protein
MDTLASIADASEARGRQIRSGEGRFVGINDYCRIFLDLGTGEALISTRRSRAVDVRTDSGHIDIR